MMDTGSTGCLACGANQAKGPEGASWPAFHCWQCGSTDIYRGDAQPFRPPPLAVGGEVATDFTTEEDDG